MPDIPDSNWSERDDRNAENVPFGWPPGLPAFIEQIGQMMMGAIKRFWNRSNPVYVTGGTLDAYTVTPEAKVSFINMYEVIRVRIDRANTTTTPTLKWSDANPRTIVKVLGAGVVPLAVGDLIAGRDHSFWYNGTNFVLSNPGTVTAAETSGLLKSANNLSDVADGPTSLTNIGGMAKATYDPQNINADAFARANQTGTQAISTVSGLQTALDGKLAVGDFSGDDTVSDTDTLLYLTGTTPKKATLVGLVSSIFTTARTISNGIFDAATFRLKNVGGFSPVFTVTSLTANRNITLQDRAITVGMTTATQQNASGANVDFTAIPAGVRRITIMIDGVSTTGANTPSLQLGGSGGVETSGYAATNTLVVNAAATAIASTATGFSFGGSNASNIYNGKIVLDLMDVAANKWTCAGIVGSQSITSFAAGTKSVAAVLDRVRLTVGGGDTYDTGTFNISWEF